MTRYRNQTSVRIAMLLAKVRKPRTVKEISNAIEADPVTVIRALRKMRKNGMVFSMNSRLFNNKAHAQELVYYLETPTHAE